MNVNVFDWFAIGMIAALLNYLVNFSKGLRTLKSSKHYGEVLADVLGFSFVMCLFGIFSLLFIFPVLCLARIEEELDEKSIVLS